MRLLADTPRDGADTRITGLPDGWNSANDSHPVPRGVGVTMHAPVSTSTVAVTSIATVALALDAIGVVSADIDAASEDRTIIQPLKITTRTAEASAALTSELQRRGVTTI